MDCNVARPNLLKAFNLRLRDLQERHLDKRHPTNTFGYPPYLRRRREILKLRVRISRQGIGAVPVPRLLLVVLLGSAGAGGAGSAGGAGGSGSAGAVLVLVVAALMRVVAAGILLRF